jgi:hypothetical protein
VGGFTVVRASGEGWQRVGEARRGEAKSEGIKRRTGRVSRSSSVYPGGIER